MIPYYYTALLLCKGEEGGKFPKHSTARDSVTQYRFKNLTAEMGVS